MVASHRIAISADEILYSLITALISCLMSAQISTLPLEKPNLGIDVRQRDSIRYADSTFIFLFEHNVWRLLVNSDSKPFKLGLDHFLVGERLVDVQNNENQMTGLCDSDDLATTTFTILGTLDNPWQIKHLDSRTVVLDLPRNGC